jgi:hypothetical protein
MVEKLVHILAREVGRDPASFYELALEETMLWAG